MAKNKRDFLTRKGLKKGEILFREGETGRQAYLVQQGTLQAVVNESGKTIELGKIGPGDIIGEMALIQDSPRSATVLAETEAYVIVISPQLMKNKLEDADPTIKAILDRMTSIIKEENEPLQQLLYHDKRQFPSGYPKCHSRTDNSEVNQI